MNRESDRTLQLLGRAVNGDELAWEELFTAQRGRLHRMVRLRMDRRAQGRIDPSDVLQEAHLEAFRCLSAYLQEPKIPFSLWLRSITRHKLLAMLRHELGAEMRDPRREVSIHQGMLPETTSAILADHLVARVTGPNTAVIRAEMRSCMQEALNDLDPLDREILALRHFEQLTNIETAHVLDIEQSAASKRYLRALKRLRGVLAQYPGVLKEL